MNLPEWISVKERKPPRRKRVVLMCIHRNKLCEIGKGVFCGRAYEWTDYRIRGYPARSVKYWMPEQFWIKEGGE